jgi:hypothetical protein
MPARPEPSQARVDSAQRDAQFRQRRAPPHWPSLHAEEPAKGDLRLKTRSAIDRQLSLQLVGIPDRGQPDTPLGAGLEDDRALTGHSGRCGQTGLA